MFEIFIKDFIHGTKTMIVTMDEYQKLLSQWDSGESVQVGESLILNKNIESMYIRKK